MVRIGKLTLVAAACGIVVAGGPLFASNAEAETKLTLNHYMFVKHFFVQQVVKGWGDKVEKLTEGRVKLDIPVAPLSPVARQWSSVETGVADLAISHDGFQRKRLQLMTIGYMPMTTVSSEKSSVALWRTYRKHFLPAKEYKGVRLIGIWQHGGSYVFNSKKPITRIEDFKSMKFRATPGIGVDTFRLLGSSVVTSAGPQVFELVSKKIVDGIAFPFDGVLRFKVDKYLKYLTYIPGSLYNQSWSLVMNQGKWNGLTRADRQAIASVSGEPVARTAGRIFDVKAKKALAKMIRNGNGT